MCPPPASQAHHGRSLASPLAASLTPVHRKLPGAEDGLQIEECQALLGACRHDEAHSGVAIHALWPAFLWIASTPQKCRLIHDPQRDGRRVLSAPPVPRTRVDIYIGGASVRD